MNFQPKHVRSDHSHLLLTHYSITNNTNWAYNNQLHVLLLHAVQPLLTYTFINKHHTMVQGENVEGKIQGGCVTFKPKNSNFCLLHTHPKFEQCNWEQKVA